MSNLSSITIAINNFNNYITDNIEHSANHRAGKTSNFWAQHFKDRDNYPSLNDFLVFRRGKFTYGVGDTKNASLRLKKVEFDNCKKSTELFTPPLIY